MKGQRSESDQSGVTWELEILRGRCPALSLFVLRSVPARIFFLNYFIVVQVQLSAFTLHSSPR